MTIHVPGSVSSRLPSRFIIGAGATVALAAALGIAIVAPWSDGSGTSEEASFTASTIHVSEAGLVAAEKALEVVFDAGFGVPPASAINATEDSIRTNEASRDVALRDALDLPGGPVVLAAAASISRLPPFASDGPAYP